MRGTLFFIFLHDWAASDEDRYRSNPNFLIPAGALAWRRARLSLSSASSSNSPWHISISSCMRPGSARGVTGSCGSIQFIDAGNAEDVDGVLLGEGGDEFCTLHCTPFSIMPVTRSNMRRLEALLWRRVSVLRRGRLMSFGLERVLSSGAASGTRPWERDRPGD